MAMMAGALGGQQAPDEVVYRDPQGRFEFRFPASWGSAGPGADSGFGDRIAALRFSAVAAAGGLGGEAVVTAGPVTVDLQALGGLYDSFTLQVFPEDTRPKVVAARPAVTPASFCRLLGEADHLGDAPPLSPALADLARQVDRMRNIDPRVVRCDVADGVVTFHKEATWEAGTVAARQHIFGAVRFLTAGLSSFQIVRGSLTPPGSGELDALARVVLSFRE